MKKTARAGQLKSTAPKTGNPLRDGRLSTRLASRKLRHYGAVLGMTAAAAFVIKTTIAVRTYGTNDVLSWAFFLETLQRSGGIALYYTVDGFNHPPFMIHFLTLTGMIARETGMSFPFWLRLPGIVADAGSVYLVWKMLASQFHGRLSPVAVLLMAAAPASIMISGFHGNTDPVMMFFVLLSLYWVDRQPWLAGAALGMAMNLKVAPVIFVPAIFLYLPTVRRRVEYFSAAGIAIALGSLPYLMQDPVFLLRRVLGYGSIYGHWGVSRLLSGLPMTLSFLGSGYADLGKYIVLGSILVISVLMNRSSERVPLFLQCGLAAFVFMSLTPGFGVQYITWLVPWVVAAGVRAGLAFHVATGVFLFLVYTFWSQGLPWHFANSFMVGDWRGPIVYFELLAWFSVVLVTVILAREVRLGPRARPETMDVKTSAGGRRRW